MIKAAYQIECRNSIYIIICGKNVEHYMCIILVDKPIRYKKHNKLSQTIQQNIVQIEHAKEMKCV